MFIYRSTRESRTGKQTSREMSATAGYALCFGNTFQILTLEFESLEKGQSKPWARSKARGPVREKSRASLSNQEYWNPSDPGSHGISDSAKLHEENTQRSGGALVERFRGSEEGRSHCQLAKLTPEFCFSLNMLLCLFVSPISILFYF